MSIEFVIALAVFLGLLLFLYQQVRRAAWPIPLGETPRRPKSKWRVVFATIPVVIAGVIIWAFFIEPNRLIVRHQTIQIAEWPRELSGIRIAVISDIHGHSKDQMARAREANRSTYGAIAVHRYVSGCRLIRSSV